MLNCFDVNFVISVFLQQLGRELYEIIERLIKNEKVDTFLFGSKSRFNDFCIVYYDEKNAPTTRKSGTKIAIDYAVKQGKQIINTA